MTPTDNLNQPVIDNPTATVTPPPPPPESPPPDPPKPPAPDGPPPPQGGPTIDVGKIFAGKFNHAETIHEIQKVVMVNKTGRSRAFSLTNDGYAIQKADQEQIASLYVANPAVIEDLIERLRTKRILIISGEAELGKRTLAIYLGSIVTEDERKQIYGIHPLERHVRVDLKKISDGRSVPANSFLFFRNACERANPDVVEFLSQLNRFSLPECSEKLRSTNSYLVFTIGIPDAEQLKSNLGDDSVLYRHDNLSRDLLVEGLERKLLHLSQQAEAAAARVAVMQQQQDLMIGTLKTMPRLARFVDYYFRSSSPDGAPVDLEETLRAFEDIHYWFQQHLAEDFDVWCFTLSLGLAHCLGDSYDVSWLNFEYLHRYVRSWLTNDAHLFPHKRQPNIITPPDQIKKPHLVDDDYFRLCRAEIVKDRNSLSDLISFRDRSYVRGVWQILLDHHRGILTALLPHLCELAEDKSHRSELPLRALCAQIIGRIGEIDPEGITAAYMDRWMYSDEVSHRSLVAFLYQGILASDNERYRTHFVERLNSLTATDVVDDEYEKNHVLTSIAVYAQIGAEHFQLAMKGLERIAGKKLVPVIEDMQRVGRLIERTDNEFAQRESVEEAIELLVYQEMLGDLAERLYAEQGSTFVGVQYAFWTLCLNSDPIQVFSELRRWIKTSNQATGALVALMFLANEGIAANLESQKFEITLDETSAEKISCNAILASLKPQTVNEMARFLVSIYESFSVSFVIPSRFKRFLHESFIFRLKTWAEEALTIESCRHSMESLFIELMRLHQRVLFDAIFRLLNDRNFCKKQPVLKKTFVDTVLWQHT